MKVMRPLLFVIALLAVLGFAQAETMDIPTSCQIDGHKEFDSLSREDALAKGERIAHADFDKGVYRVFVYGKRRMLTLVNEQNLRDQYGIVSVPIAGCVVSEGILGAAEGYNRTMKSLLNKKFGTDVFAGT